MPLGQVGEHSARALALKGPWSPEEKKLHINCLELMAAFLVLRTFLRSHPVSHVHLRMDNQTAVAYINNMGGTVSA